MKRLWLLLLLLLFPMTALATELDVRVNQKNEARGFDDNTISIDASAAGQLTMTIGDEYGAYFTWNMAVEAGETVIPWNGLGWNMERITDGRHTLTAELVAADGTTASTSVKVNMKRCRNAMTFAIPVSRTLWLEEGEEWFCEVRTIRMGDTVRMEVCRSDEPDVLLGAKRMKIAEGGPVKFRWDGKLNGKALESGEYVLTYYLVDNPAYAHDVPLTIAAGSSPAYEVTVSQPVMPERGMTDEAIWQIMQLPSVVADVKQDKHLTICAGKGTGVALGTVHGQSQGLQVLELDGDFARVGAWNHETGDYVEGWVQRSALKVVVPDTEYGLLIDKAEQTMTVYHQGKAIDTFAISTGLATKKQQIRETPAGAYLTVDRIGNFESYGYQYDHVIRYDGGNLIHQMGYVEDGAKHDFSDQAPLIGAKASHGCIRVPNTLSANGINAYWLYTHLPYHTRVIILDDPEQRQQQAAEFGLADAK